MQELQLQKKENKIIEGSGLAIQHFREEEK